MFTYTFFKLNLDGSKSHRENLNADELDGFLASVYGKFATVLVERSDGKQVVYTDNGSEWVLAA
jgi:hypothetical protein